MEAQKLYVTRGSKLKGFHYMMVIMMSEGKKRKKEKEQPETLNEERNSLQL